jgi:hypothetical protein
MLATQRTQDIPEDILSQIGFIISHKLSNEDDLRLIKMVFIIFYLKDC